MFTASLKIRDIVILAGCAALLAGCGKNIKTGGSAGMFAPDQYQRLAERISEGHIHLSNKKVAVLPFSYIDHRDSNDGTVVSERLLTRIMNIRKLEIVERGLLEKVLAELKLQRSGAIDESSIKDIGKIIGVEAVVTGTMTRHRDGRIEINARLIRTESAAVLSAAAETITPEWETTGVTSPAAWTRPVAPRTWTKPAPPAASSGINALISPVKRPGCPRGMAAYWNFDEAGGATAYDAFGMSNARLVDGPVWTPGGKVGGALQFDGSNDRGDYLNAGNSLDLSAGDFTLMAWVYPVDFTYERGNLKDNARTIISAFDSNMNRGYLFAVKDGQLAYYSNTWGVGGSLVLNKWQHAVVTVTRVAGGMSDYILYLGGKIVGSGSKPEFVRIHPTAIGVYQPHTVGVSHFKGAIDEVAIYNRVLSAGEITGLYKKGLTGKGYCARP